MADQYYIEQDYFDGKYFGVIFDAVISLNPYIEEGYYDGDYYVPAGGQASLSCTAEVVTGVVVEANGTPTSNFTLTFSITRIKPLSASMASEFTSQTLANKLNDIDIYAFSTGQLSSSVGAIRDYEITASAQFSISIDFVRRRQADSDGQSNVSIVIDIERYRDFDSAQQVAFSFAVAETKFRPASADLTASATLSATISHIQGADIILDDFASVSCDAVKTADAEIITNSQTDLTTIVGVIFNNSANLFSYFGLLTSKYFGIGRPRHLAGIDYQYLNEYFTTLSKFGTYALKATSPTISITARSASAYTIIPKANEDWVFEFWYYNGTHSTHDLFSFFVGGGMRFIRLISNDTRTFTLRLMKEGVYSIQTTYTTQEASNVWLHVAVAYQNGYASLFVNGQRRIQQDWTAFTAIDWTGRTIESQDLIMRLSVRDNARLDEASFRRGTTLGFNPQSTTLTVPTAARTNDFNTTQFLYHFENNGLDDISLTQTTSALLTSSFTITATLNGTQEFATLQASQATLTADIGIIKTADSSLACEFTQSTDAERIRITDANLASEFTQSASADRTRTDTADLSSQASLSFAIGIIKTADIDTDAVATQLTAVGRIGDFFINCESAFTQSTTAVKTTDITSVQSVTADMQTDGIIEVSGEADLTAQADLTVTGIGVRTSLVDLTTAFTQTTTANFIVDAEAGIEFDVIAGVEATTQGLIGIQVAMVSASAMSITAVKITDTDATMDGVFNFNTSADRLRSSAVDLSSTATLTADASAIRDVAITTDSIATQLSIVVKIADFFINSESQFVLNIDAVKTADMQSALAVEATVSAIPYKIHSSADATLSTVADITATGFVGAVGNADIGAVFTTQSSATATFDSVGSLTAIASIECDVDIIRGAASITFAFGDVFADARRFRGITQELTAQASLSCQPNYTFGGEVIIAGAMTATIAIRAIHVDIYVYKIPQETRTYAIIGENRSYTLIGEDRSYTIRR